MKRIAIIGLLTFCVICSACQMGTKQQRSEQLSNRKQNVVLILVDDLGWADVSYNGSEFYETPHIDELSRSSFVFTDAYAAGSVCSPSRAAILTGKHPVRVGITDWLQGQNPKDRKYLGSQDLEQMPLEEITIAEVLKESDYKTFFSGKWHVGGEGFYPEDQGFDINIGGHHKGSPPGGYYSPYNNPKLTDGPQGEYLTDRLTNEAIDFLSSSQDDPFFMMLSFYTVHTPIQANKRHLSKFKAKLAGMPDSLIRTKVDGGGLTVLNQTNAAYASMVYAMDENVGRLIADLKARGLYDNTTIIFTSDNGGLSTLEKHRRKPAPTSVLPLRGGKGWLYEGGVRVPLLIKPAFNNLASSEISVPVVGHDLFPTICNLTGVGLLAENPIDGVDLSSLFEGDIAIDREELFWHYPHYHGSGWTPGAALRQGDWKLIEFYADKKVELYNLKDDIGETEDLSRIDPIKLSEMRKRLKKLQSEMNAQYSTPNPNFKDSK